MRRYQKKKHHLMLFFNCFLVLGILLGGGWYGYHQYQENKAHMALQDAVKTARQLQTQKKRASPATVEDAFAVTHYGDQTAQVTNEESMSDFLRDQQVAIKMGVPHQAAGRLHLPKIHQDLPIYDGATPYTLSLGVATFFYDDAVMGKGNFVVAGHNMEQPGILFSDLTSLVKGDAMDLIGENTIYRYRVDRQVIVPGSVDLLDGKPENDSFLSLPQKEDRPKLTLFTCIYTKNGKERYVVQGHLTQLLSNE